MPGIAMIQGPPLFLIAHLVPPRQNFSWWHRSNLYHQMRPKSDDVCPGSTTKPSVVRHLHDCLSSGTTDLQQIMGGAHIFRPTHVTCLGGAPAGMSFFWPSRQATSRITLCGLPSRSLMMPSCRVQGEACDDSLGCGQCVLFLVP